MELRSLEIEKSGESKLLEVIRAHGFKAWHMDCTVDGMPDILALGKWDSFTIEVKYGPLSKPLVEAFEPSQPIWHYGVNKAGYENTFQVLYDDHKNFHLYRLANLYNDVISKPAVLFRDLRPLASGSAEEVVSAIEKWIGTEKE